MEITLNKKEFIKVLKQAATFVSAGDCENILSGVNINVDTENKRLEIASTDGNKLFYMPLDYEYTEKFIKSKRGKKPLNVTIPAKFIKGVKAEKCPITALIMEFKGDKIYFENLLAYGSVEIGTIPASYPKYKQLIETEFKARDKKLTSLNANYLAQICSIFKDGCRNRFDIYTDGLKAVYFTSPEFEAKGGYMLLMPFETPEDRDEQRENNDNG